MGSDRPATRIRFIIADDHPTYREGLSRLISDEPDFECVGIAGEGEEAVQMARELHPDVAIVDINMPGMNGIKATQEIRAASPNTAVLVVSAFDYVAYILPSLRAGASGYMLKNSSLEEILGAIRLVHSGETVLDSAAVGSVLSNLKSDASSGKMATEELAGREFEVLTLAARGMSNKEIASELTVSERTVQTHLVNIFKKLSVSSRTQAVLYALRKGWLCLEDLQ